MKTIYLKVSIAENYDDVCDQLVLEDFISQPGLIDWNIELISESEVRKVRE